MFPEQPGEVATCIARPITQAEFDAACAAVPEVRLGVVTNDADDADLIIEFKEGV